MTAALGRCPACGAQQQGEPFCWLCNEPIAAAAIPAPAQRSTAGQQTAASDLRWTRGLLIAGMLAMFFGSLLLRGPAFLLAMLLLPALALNLPGLVARREQEEDGWHESRTLLTSLVMIIGGAATFVVMSAGVIFVIAIAFFIAWTLMTGTGAI